MDLQTVWSANPAQAAEWSTYPQAMPTASTDIFTRDITLREITVTNGTSGDLTFSLYDRQGTPIPVFYQTTVPANGAYSLDFRGRWCPGGLTIQASGVGLVYTVRGF